MLRLLCRLAGGTLTFTPDNKGMRLTLTVRRLRQK